MARVTEMLELVARVALAGAGGSVVMDLWGWAARRSLGVRSLDYGLLGRWVGHVARGRLRHESIVSAEPVRGERLLGWISHYTIGTSFALLLLLTQGPSWVQEPTLWPALAVGWVTLLAPWFVMQPGMGLGIAAARTPRPGAARLRNLASHTAYGLGLYAAAVALAPL